MPGSGVPLGAKNLGARNQGRTGDKVVAPVGAWGGDRNVCVFNSICGKPIGWKKVFKQ